MAKRKQCTEVEFSAGDRTYRCAVQGKEGVGVGPWWWFEVTGDQSRYAPFRFEPTDSANTVQTRVVEYYEKLLESRANPSHWWNRKSSERQAARAAKAPEKPATTEVTA